MHRHDDGGSKLLMTVHNIIFNGICVILTADFLTYCRVLQ